MGNNNDTGEKTNYLLEEYKILREEIKEKISVINTIAYVYEDKEINPQISRSV